VNKFHPFPPCTKKPRFLMLNFEPEHPLARFDILHCLNQFDRLREIYDLLSTTLRTCQIPWHSARNRVLLPCENLSFSNLEAGGQDDEKSAWEEDVKASRRTLRSSVRWEADGKSAS